MPDPAYAVARKVARALALEHELMPPFDLERLVGHHALLIDEPLPTQADAIVLHAQMPGDRPRIAIDAGLAESPQRRRFAIAHALGHVVLGWHPFGSPCDVSTAPSELPATVHDLVEGEANAFARELLVPAAWIDSMGSTDRPAQLISHASDRAGVPPAAAARAVAAQLAPGHVWVVADRWDRVLDAGRSPGTRVSLPRLGMELDGTAYARHSIERHRAELDGCTLVLWRFDDSAAEHVPHDRSARDLVHSIGQDLGLGDGPLMALAARVDGVSGWANEHVGSASLTDMDRALRDRVGTMPELAQVAAHPAFDELIAAKSTELVAKRLAR